MVESMPDDPYLGCPKFSYVPEGLVAHIAPAPGQLCSKCNTIDFTSYFNTGLDSERALQPVVLPDNEVDDTSHNTCLGTYDEVSRRALGCEFCQLVIKALAATTAKLHRRGTLQHGAPVYLDSVMSGTYYDRATASSAIPNEVALETTRIDSSKQVNVRCIMVSLYESRATQPDSAFIRLLANDAHLLGQKPLYHGRLIGNHASPALLRTWIKTCNDHHKECTKIRFKWGLEHLAGPRSLRYIDTVDMCLRSRHMLTDLSHHVSLSYVWGRGSQGLQLLKSNVTQLQVKGALRDAWSHIPAVIRDAIELVRDLNTGGEDEPAIRLWVDQLCIIQDDPKDKATQIHQMNQIYSSAIATLIATEGSHSNVALSRHHCHTVSFVPRLQGPLSSGQMIKNIQGLRLLAALPSLPETTALSVWATRAWTMQEVELSHASIFFGRDQVIFRCAQEVFREDFVAEITGQGYRDIGITHPKWLNSQALERRAVPVEDKDWPITFEWYSTLVENYTQRAMTYPTDILPAFAGVTQIFHAVCAWKISNGLIEDVIDYSLLWRPKGIIHRRFTQNGDPNQKQQNNTNQCLPTYAWCAWLGQVVYEPRTYDIRSLIARFEVAGAGKSKRQLVRFSQDIESGALEPSTLEPKFPYAPQDCSYFQDMSQGFYWMKPQVQNLAHRFHLAKHTYNTTIDGPGIMQFTTKCVRLVLSTLTASTQSHNEQKEGCRRVWLLDSDRRKVGTVWYAPALDTYDNEKVQAILLSKNRGSAESEDWQFDRSIGAWEEWCLCNVMLIKRLPGAGLSERLTVGKLHEQAAQSGGEETIRLV
ncbi:MAG: hypothetical protein Q9221_004227 [Calogaya cf. arnoldii]